MNWEREKKSLKYALNINLEKLLKFELYRKKDDRSFRFIVYDGKNYEYLCEYLQNGNRNIRIPEESRLRVGSLYNVNGKNKFNPINRRMMTKIIAMNPYIICDETCCFQAFNYDIAKWLLENYKGLYLKNLPEINYSKKAKSYGSINDLEKFPEGSCYKTDNVWILSCNFRKDIIDIESIPPHLLDSYKHANDGYQEFEIFYRNGLKGLKLYGFEDKILLNPEFLDIITENYRAYVKNIEGLWAEYHLKNHIFLSDFIYTNIEINPKEGFVAAYLEGNKVILHSPRQSANQHIINKGGYFGVESSKGIIIENIYDSISFFGAGYEVFKDGKYGLIDNNGEVILECIYENIIIKNTSSPIFHACKNGLWGIVGKEVIYYDFCDDQPSDEKYNASVNLYINKIYKQHRLLKTTLKSIDKETGLIHMQICDFNKDFEIDKNQLPNIIYKQVVSGYVKALQILGRSALKVNDDGIVEYSYTNTTNWISYRKNIKQLEIGDVRKGTICKLTSVGVIVKLENGIYGKMKCDIQSYQTGDCVICKVIQITKNSLYLEKCESKR